MKKSGILVLSVIMALVLIFSLAGCGKEKVTLSTRTVYGLKFEVPDDFGEFEPNQDGIMLAADEDSTASITVSDITVASGHRAGSWTQESYQEAILQGLTDIKLIEFDNNVKISYLTAVYAHFTAKNSKGADVEVYNYLIYWPEEDGQAFYQGISFNMNKNADTSLKDNIEVILESLSTEY
ncbi:MAG TPA: hypothetical protein PK830_05180 [Candidatus Atribacteria bacterium]|nr:hypothetical protein [Candidatus Atribacteria bacterium]HPT78476.1 hypothetical protein [Candidatus Atribacteria bacterium]